MSATVSRAAALSEFCRWIKLISVGASGNAAIFSCFLGRIKSRVADRMPLSVTNAIGYYRGMSRKVWAAAAGAAVPVLVPERAVQLVFDAEWMEKEGLQVARALVDSSRGSRHATRTVAAYAADWRDFVGWCSRSGRQSLPAVADTVALYVADLSSRLKPSTLQRRVAAIAHQHEAAGFALVISGVVRNVLATIRRKPTARVRRVAAISPKELAAVAAQLDGLATIRGCRDRAVILLGFSAALRRSEIVGFDLSDVELRPDRLDLNIARSKTDQDGRGRQLAIPRAKSAGLCAVRALRAWLRIRGDAPGPLFFEVSKVDQVVEGKRMGDYSVYYTLRRAAAAVGLDASKFGAHSLRAGAATAAADAGADVWQVMQLTGHKSMDVAASYVRRGAPRYALRGVL